MIDIFALAHRQNHHMYRLLGLGDRLLDLASHVIAILRDILCSGSELYEGDSHTRLLLNSALLSFHGQLPVADWGRNARGPECTVIHESYARVSKTSSAVGPVRHLLAGTGSGPQRVSLALTTITPRRTLVDPMKLRDERV